MSKNKTKKTKDSPIEFLEKILPESKRQDCFHLLGIMQEVTGDLPVMWGSSIIGFGDYHYKYESGREGDMCRIGFSPRAKNIVIYIMPGYQDFSKELPHLGKHKIGKSCLYINKLSDVDEAVLRIIMKKGLKLLEAKYPTKTSI